MKQPPTVTVPSPSQGDIEAALFGLAGIFWALDLLVIHHVADGYGNERTRADGIERLVIVGREISKNMPERI